MRNRYVVCNDCSRDRSIGSGSSIAFLQKKSIKKIYENIKTNKINIFVYFSIEFYFYFNMELNNYYALNCVFIYLVFFLLYLKLVFIFFALLISISTKKQKQKRSILYLEFIQLNYIRQFSYVLLIFSFTNKMSKHLFGCHVQT